MRISKLHATGNDFLVLASDLDPGPAAAAALCDRHRGVGADGFIVCSPGADGADATMILRNADGGVAEMSGNGIRCLAWVAVAHGMARGDRLVVETGSGRRELDLVIEDGRLVRATCDMGPVTFDPALVPVDESSALDLVAVVDDTEYEGDAAGMGNPHFVLMVEAVDEVPLHAHGAALERDPRFPRRTNVEFVQPVAPDRLRMRVWERGVGETLSCGTGACAAAAVAHRRDLVGEHVLVDVPGGGLSVDLGTTIRLGGPVRHVFDLDIDPDTLDLP